MTLWRSGMVESGGEEIYFEVTGDDPDLPLVVLTHGAGGSHAVWYRQVVALADSYRVVTWDTRGFGNSTFRSGVHGAAAAAADLGAVLDAVPASGPVHLVGQSMGGWWVVEFALARPERTRSLTLSCTIGSLYTDALDEHFRTYLAGARLGPETHLGEHPALSPAVAERDPATAFLYQQLNTFHTPPMLDVGAALATTRHDHAQVAALGIPVLVVAGEHDPIFPASLLADSAALVPGARFAEIAGSGHSPYFERPDEFTAVLRAFLDEVGRGNDEAPTD